MMRLKHIFFWPLFLALRLYWRWALRRWKKLILTPFESYHERNLMAPAYAHWVLTGRVKR